MHNANEVGWVFDVSIDPLVGKISGFLRVISFPPRPAVGSACLHDAVNRFDQSIGIAHAADGLTEDTLDAADRDLYDQKAQRRPS